MEQEVHFVDPLVRMPMSAEPRLVLNCFFDGIKPTLCAVIHGALIDPTEKHLGWLILERASMRQDYVEGLAFDLLLYESLDLR